MNKPGKIIPRGPFKGKRIELAPTEELDMFRSLAEEFMEAIFCMEPGSYLITDESSLRDFKGGRGVGVTRHAPEDSGSVWCRCVRHSLGKSGRDLRSNSQVYLWSRAVNIRGTFSGDLEREPREGVSVD